MAERYYTMYSKYYRNILAVNGRYKKVASSNTVDGRCIAIDKDSQYLRALGDPFQYRKR